jgi:hypothetical protein
MLVYDRCIEIADVQRGLIVVGIAGAGYFHNLQVLPEGGIVLCPRGNAGSQQCNIQKMFQDNKDPFAAQPGKGSSMYSTQRFDGGKETLTLQQI